MKIETAGSVREGKNGKRNGKQASRKIRGSRQIAIANTLRCRLRAVNFNQLATLKYRILFFHEQTHLTDGPRATKKTLEAHASLNDLHHSCTIEFFLI